MRFLFIASGRRVPSTRFRIQPYIAPLRSIGHHCDVAYSFPEKYDYFPLIGWRASQLLKRSMRRLHVLRARLQHYDTILIEREVFDDDTSHIEQALRSVTPRLVLDVDDGIHLLHPNKFELVAGMCDAAIAGNWYLERVLHPLCPTVSVIPTCVTLAQYPLRSAPVTPPNQSSPTPLPTIGWMGTTQNVQFLSVCASALRRLARETDFRLLVVAPEGDRLRELDLTGVDIEFRKWDPRREVRDLHEMDVGLMPLPEDQPWMKFKCGLKLIQYLAIGIPGVASPIGVNDEILAGNHVGFAVQSEDEWYTALKQLLADPDLRRELGLAGRTLVREHYSIEANVGRLANVLTGGDGPTR